MSHLGHTFAEDTSLSVGTFIWKVLSGLVAPKIELAPTSAMAANIQSVFCRKVTVFYLPMIRRYDKPYVTRRTQTQNSQP